MQGARLRKKTKHARGVCRNPFFSICAHDRYIVHQEKYERGKRERERERERNSARPGGRGESPSCSFEYLGGDKDRRFLLVSTPKDNNHLALGTGACQPGHKRVDGRRTAGRMGGSSDKVEDDSP